MVLPVLVAAQETQTPGGPLDEQPDTLLAVRRNMAGIAFERNLNTYNWSGRASIDTTVWGTAFSIRQLYSSNLIVLEGGASRPGQRPRSDQQRLMLSIAHPITANVRPTARFSSFVYTDNKAVGLSKASNHSLMGGMEYLPFPLVSITPMLGYRIDRQFENEDRGVEYVIGLSTREITMDGYRFRGLAEYDESRLDPRRLESHVARASVQKQFTSSTQDSLEVGFRRQRREFYTLGGGGIEGRKENILTFTNVLDYEVQRSLSTTLFFSIVNRSLDKEVRAFLPLESVFEDARIEEFRLHTWVEMRYRSDDGLGMSARIGFNERSETHSVRAALNNTARRTALSGTIDIPLSLSDRLSMTGSASILRYDTPSDLNTDDRDELLVVLSLSTLHTVSRHLTLGITVDGTLSHLVYLHSSLSQNNNRNRVLRLSPRTLLRPSASVTSLNAFEVLANYTVFDFEDKLFQAKSFSYRQFSWVDSTAVRLSARMWLDFLLYLKLYERGQLNWGEFKERRENSFVDETYALQVGVTPVQGATFIVGVRFVGQRRYGFATGDRIREAVVRSLGPTCLLRWEMSSRSDIELTGWYERRSQANGATKGIANMALNIHLSL